MRRGALIPYGELMMEDDEHGNWQPRGWVRFNLYQHVYQRHHCLQDPLKDRGSPMYNWRDGDESDIGAATHVAESLHPSTIHRRAIGNNRSGPV